MAKVVGLGGVFFRCDDNDKTGAWYRDTLGIALQEYGGASFKHADVAKRWPAGAYTVWGPFARDTTYFDPSTSEFMINLMVDDLDGALSQVAAAGGQVVGDVESHDFGRFGWFVDPDGRKVELWEPVAEPSS